jgi:hypothetical protein
MSTILNFENWNRLNESTVSTVPGQTPADLAALDQIQLMADRGPTMLFNGASYTDANKAEAQAAGPETLITSVAGTLNTGRVTKTITFTAIAGTKKWKIKAEFFGKDGKLNAIVYQDDKQVLNGPVVIKNHSNWKQLMSIGDKTGAFTESLSGAHCDNASGRNSVPAPVSGGICDILSNNGMANSADSLSSPLNPPRKGSNVKFSAKNVELTNFMNAEIAKRAKATPAPSKP